MNDFEFIDRKDIIVSELILSIQVLEAWISDASVYKFSDIVLTKFFFILNKFNSLTNTVLAIPWRANTDAVSKDSLDTLKCTKIIYQMKTAAFKMTIAYSNFFQINSASWLSVHYMIVFYFLFCFLFSLCLSLVRSFALPMAYF